MKSLLLCLLLPFAFQEHTYTVGEVMRHARQLHNDSAVVQITGYVTRKLRDNNYMFEDRTAEIQVDIDPKYLPKTPFTDKDAVTIKALVQYEINKPITLKVSQPVSND
ncbi:NirD/YgiW/YdeI family stress tolerance protein [Chitinophaga sp. 22321]|uniref:NirD/YgiW/YdeI family stress tolerance protein n=1 Tax=Chitinophaga hostae TaxID=2831022 RepID=A0ABS5J6T1_9BACT|nr:NirD/YgiW/YdeI family stress tolerance protein [Chitinophaga hostae]MBS0030147.1 NirD/YgiW/YdeI family stress tolerance protein [Chitinophaga hostae]